MTFAFAQLSSSRQETATDLYRGPPNLPLASEVLTGQCTPEQNRVTIFSKHMLKT